MYPIMLAHNRGSINVFNKYLLSSFHVSGTVLDTKISALIELPLKCEDGSEDNNNDHNEEANSIVQQMAT